MMKKRYFYFASSHSFSYPLYVKFKFKKKDGLFICRKDHSLWVEAKNYRYYGEPVNCIIPAQKLEYDFVLNLLTSEIKDNIFGAINYLLCNHRERFLLQVKTKGYLLDTETILFQYFKKELQM